MKTVVLYNKANEFGLRQDALLIQSSIPCELRDPLEPAAPCDFAIHLEVPYYGWMAFARVNAIVVNPEWWEEAWNPYLKRADYLFFKCQADMDRFLGAYATKENHTYEGKAVLVPWASASASASASSPKTGNEWLWLLGGSVNKREAALKILPLWKAEWPPLLVYTTSPLSLDSPLAANVTLRVEDLTSKKRQTLQAAAACHLIFSASEALCMSAMEGEACGAFLLGNSLPTYVESIGSADYVHLTPSTLEPYKAGVKDTFAGIQENLEASVQAVLAKLETSSFSKTATQKSTYRRNAFKAALQKILPVPISTQWQPMRFLTDEELPKISVVTLTYNRKKFLDLAFHNLLSTDYPKDKIEWVVVDDSDDPAEQASDKIIKFGRENAPMSMAYIPLAKRTIGRKRNVGIFRSENPIILFMDDDDHYPPSSFRRRVSALLTHPWKPEAVVCSTIACYDLQNGISAVNTPPWSLGLSKRVSEATLTFYKSFWEVKNFPKVNMAEGDEFIDGRADSVLEIPPQQIIVAMTHGSNSSRRFPTGGTPSCFWGFPKEFLVFLHGLVGVQVEE
jgi:hypothetical protein